MAVSSYSRMEQICFTLSMAMKHGLITQQTWNKMAHGVITSFSVQQQISLKRAFMWSAVYTMMKTSGHMVLLMKASHQYQDIFMRYTMSAFHPYKVRREKRTSRAFQFDNDEDQLTSVAKFENLLFPLESTSSVEGLILALLTLLESLPWLVS